MSSWLVVEESTLDLSSDQAAELRILLDELVWAGGAVASWMEVQGQTSQYL